MAQTRRVFIPSVLLAVLCASTAAAAALRSLQGVPACTWPGHCLGDPCKTADDCDKTWVCVSKKCAVPGGPTPTPTPRPKPTPAPSKRTTITSYNVMSFDNTSPGDLVEHTVSQSFVNNINIAAVHSKYWPSYKYKQVQITYKKKSATFQVWDLCADSDCDNGSCCTDNMNANNNGFLLDLDSSAVKRIWGISNAESTLFASATFVLLPTPVNVQAELAKYP